MNTTYQVCVLAGPRAHTSHYVQEGLRAARCGRRPGNTSHWQVLPGVLTASCGQCRALVAEEAEEVKT